MVGDVHQEQLIGAEISSGGPVIVFNLGAADLELTRDLHLVEHVKLVEVRQALLRPDDPRHAKDVHRDVGSVRLGYRCSIKWRRKHTIAGS